MEDLHFPGTRHTPDVKLQEGQIRFTGRSVPSDPELFFSPIVDWIKSYCSGDMEHTLIELKFEYINTASTKWIFNILKLLGEHEKAGEKLNISWYYEQGDDDMFDLGMIFQSLVPSEFKFIETPEIAS
jgi:hypothetical protein